MLAAHSHQFDLVLSRTYIVENNQGRSPTTSDIADGVEKTMVVDCGYQLLNKECQKDGADSREVKVVNHERTIEFEGWSISH